MILNFVLFGRCNWSEAMGGARDAFARNGKYVGKLVRKRPIGRRRRGWEKKIKMELKEIVCDGVYRIHLPQHTVYLHVLLKTVMNVLFRK
jgi:hypothetical protein